ncbi:translation initiation factor IF-1 [Sphingomonas lycopersici]|uniref:Translation initiation factor IF-1 n=1 Tax=Sphingomonas lycopersici TaxID=2951807 RepID=A0AA41Z6L5_9SPHN|nr:translation initiation factor IF-1 [Sphingomonas lycopersici]MCW6533789.1 translation initiation factor IF-1 [Sphingomonas lycopersici]
MTKEGLLTLDGQVDELLPDGRFRVSLENGHRIVAYTAGKLRKYHIRMVVGDHVMVEMSPYDLEKGRLIYRERVVNTGFSRHKGKRR